MQTPCQCYTHHLNGCYTLMLLGLHAGHDFCRKCLKQALQHQRRCPKCRTPIATSKPRLDGACLAISWWQVRFVGPRQPTRIRPYRALTCIWLCCCKLGFCACECLPLAAVELTWHLGCKAAAIVLCCADAPICINTVLWNTIKLLFPKHAANAPESPADAILTPSSASNAALVANAVAALPMRRIGLIHAPLNPPRWAALSRFLLVK